MRRIRVPAVLAVLAALAAAAEPPRDVRTLLSHRAAVEAPAGEIVRLRLGPEVLARSRPDLADLRLVGASGTLVPFVVDSDEDPAGTAARVLVTRAATITNVDRAEERREHAPTFWRETYELAVEQDGDVRDAAWELVLATRRRGFVRHVDVEAMEGGARTPLASRAPVFVLDGAGGEAARLAVPIGELPARLRVTIAGEGDGWLEPSFVLRATRPVPDVARARVSLEILARDDAGGTTTLDLAVPGALVPDRLHFATSTGALQRGVTVWIGAPGTDDASGLVGRGIVARAAPGDPLDPAEVQLRLRDGRRLPPGAGTLRVSIANGDSPPLADLVVTALVPVPVLLFVAPAEPVRLHFGGTRVDAPRFDVAALAAKWRDAARGGIPEATLGAVEASPDHDPTPLLEIAMQPAKAVDRRLFSHVRPLAIPTTPDGLAHVDLDVADVVVAREDLADVRIVDAGDRQWPYLVDDAPVHRWVTAALEGRRRGPGGWSRHLLRIAEKPVPIDRIEIASPVPVVGRDVRVLASEKAGAPVLAEGTIGRDPFVAVLGGARHETLVVAVRDGDEEPLPLTSARVRVMLPRLDVVAPAGEYTLLLGHRDADPPDYALARVRTLVGEARGAVVVPGPLRPNPAHSARAGLFGGAWLERIGPRIAVWGVLVLGGLVLVALTLRAVRT